MEYPRAKIMRLLVEFFANDYRRIEHAIRVLHHAESIMKTREDYDGDIVVACALLHDLGIKPSEEKLGYNDGKSQEKYGPPVAEALLRKIDFPSDKIQKVKEIIGNHHSASRYDYIELAILKEADRIVNEKEQV